MSDHRKRQYCPKCKEWKLAHKSELGCGFHIVNIIIVFFTGGIWLLPYLLLSACALGIPYKCPDCGADTEGRLAQVQKQDKVKSFRMY